MENSLITLLGLLIASFCFFSLGAYKQEIKKSLPNSTSNQIYSSANAPKANRAQRRGMKVPYRTYA